VVAMFRATGSEKSLQCQDTDLSSPGFGSFVSESNCENNMNLSNISAPVPKPRFKPFTTASQQTSSKLTLSDWDLEDFDD